METSIKDVIRLTTPENLIAWIVAEAVLLVLLVTTGSEFIALLAAIGVVIVGVPGILLLVVLPATVMVISHRRTKALGIITERLESRMAR